MITRIELYGVIALVLMAVLLGAYFKGTHDGYQKSEDKAAIALAAANAKADALQIKLDTAARDSATRYEDERTRHETELAAARSTVSDRLCRPATSSGQMRSVSLSPASTPAAPASDPVPRPAQGTDEWRFAFVAACLHDSDALKGWQDWWVGQSMQ